jgi:PAS domain S-box-containing protein
MEAEGRKTAIDVVGDVPWGTHLCQFYRTKEDLIEILVPFFRAGLEHNEFCIWITSEPLNAADAHKALNEQVRNLDDYIEKGQIEILDHRQWYARSESFDPSRVLRRYVEKERRALKRGFEGLRVSGNSSWLDKCDWGQFTEYEAVINNAIGEHRTLCICAYSLYKCSASQIVDVVSNHRSALIKHNDGWRIIEGSERKKAHETLRKSEERYALAQRVANIGSWDWDIQTGDLYWSDRIEPLFGFARGQFGATYEAFLDCVHPDDRRRVVDSVNASIEQGDDYAIEHRIVWPDGTVRWVSEAGDVIRDEQGNAIRMLGIIQDVTERKKVEETLRRSEANYRTIFNSASDAIFVHDIDTAKILSVNDKACQMYGYTREEFKQLTVEDLSTGMPPYVRDRAARWLKKAVKEGPQLVEWVCRDKTGRQFWVEVNLKTAVIEDRKCVLAIVRDITERREVDEVIQENEKLFRNLFENAGEALFLINPEGAGFVGVNQRACDALGYKREELLKMSVSDVDTAHSEQKHDELMLTLRKDKPVTLEVNHKKKDGTIFPVEIRAGLIEIKGESRILAMARDISDRKDMEARQKLAGGILECLNRGRAWPDTIRDVLKLVKDATGFDAVAIRHREGHDFPYLEVDGFSDDFVKAENYLCRRDEAGELVRDSHGRPVVECMCGNVLLSRTDPALPFFTEGGSFWANDTTQLLARTPPQDLQVPTRNRCNQAGYESVALIPLRSGDEIVGLLQLNDSRPGRFTPEMIRFFEEIGASIGIGMARIRAEQEAENLARFPSENPNPVLRIARDGTVLHANAAASELLEYWRCKVGGRAPEHWRRKISRLLESGLNEDFEATCKDKIFSLIMAPFADSGYVNVYGSDITKRKHAEADLREYWRHLEELVQTRTAELTQANEKLLQQIEERKRLEKEILNISEREQRRIGRELHDSIGQQFTGIAFMMKVLEQKLTDKLSGEAAGVAEIKELVNQAMDQTRGLAKGLHPVDLDPGSLTAVLQELAATTEKMFGIRCAVKCDETVAVDDAEVATHLYRITQEAITNAVKHGRANNIRVELTCRNEKTVLTVENDGRDFPENPESRGAGMGLHIMNHRADIIGASLDIRKAAKDGTILTCSFRSNRR